MASIRRRAKTKTVRAHLIEDSIANRRADPQEALFGRAKINVSDYRVPGAASTGVQLSPDRAAAAVRASRQVACGSPFGDPHARG